MRKLFISLFLAGCSMETEICNPVENAGYTDCRVAGNRTGCDGFGYTVRAFNPTTRMPVNIPVCCDDTHCYIER